MKTKLNFFDKLMMAVTFAEAGVETPQHGVSANRGQKSLVEKGTKGHATRERKILVANG